jgi:hypothetical protein
VWSKQLRVVLTLEAAAFASLPPSPGDETLAVWNTHARRVIRLWSEECSELRARLRPPTRLLLCGPGERDWSATECRLMCCILRVGERSTSALSLSRTRPFSTEELRLLDQLQPVLQLGDERQVEVGRRSVLVSPLGNGRSSSTWSGGSGTRTSRERWGTSPATVRNQLVRLYRKTGVATRLELVGLADVAAALQRGGGRWSMTAPLPVEGPGSAGLCDPSELVPELTRLALASACKAEFRGRALALLSRTLPLRPGSPGRRFLRFGDFRVVYPPG